MIKIAVVGLSDGWSSIKLAESVEKKTGFSLLIDMEKVYYDSAKLTVFYEDTDLMNLDAIIIKKIGVKYGPDLLDRLELLHFLSERGLKIFSRPESILRGLNRLSCTLRLRVGDIPMPEMIVTEDLTQAYKAVQRFGKAVFKPLFTSKARGMEVLKADDPDLKERIHDFRDSGNKTMYIQKFMEHPGKDMGITFLGGKYVATYARVGSGDSWNTTTHSGGKYQPYQPDESVIRLAQKAQQLFDLDFTCVDVVETPEGPMVFEVSVFGGFRGLWEAQHIDAAELYTDYVLEKI